MLMKLDKEKCFAALLTDLSETLDRLSRELLKAKLQVCSFDLPTLKLIQRYLSKRKQRTKFDTTYSFWE